jgi:hypothetical protein
MDFCRENAFVGEGFTPAGGHKARPYIFMGGVTSTPGMIVYE